VDPGEVVSTTVKREFIEEAMNSLALSEDDWNRLNQQIGDFFRNYSEVGKNEGSMSYAVSMLPKPLWINIF